MVRKILFVLPLLGLLLTACSTAPTQDTKMQTITGTVTYLQRIALPPDAVVTVQVQDVSLADAPAKVLGEQIIPTEGKQVPIPFEVSYDPQKIEDRHRYHLFAKIEDGSGKLLFITDTFTPIITDDYPTQDVNVTLVQVGN